MAGIDDAKDRFDQIRAEIDSLGDALLTEQDARFQIIDRILVEVLGWPRDSILTERRSEGGYTDYLVGREGGNRLVVEAKRASAILVDAHNPRMQAYKVGGPALKSAADGIEQAKRYCADHAVLFSALTSGREWIGFWALRTDGVPPLDGKAIVFPSLDAVADQFAAFYDLFSREGIGARLFEAMVHEHEGLRVQHAENLEAWMPEARIRLLEKSELGAELDVIFRRFFGVMSGENDPEMLAKCFVESKESREADATLEKITSNLINRIDVVDSGSSRQLETEIRSAIETQNGEFVLIIGNKGAGKSTFIDRFFRLVLQRELRERCLILRIDVADSTGDEKTVARWLVSRLLNETEAALFGTRPATYDELQGAFKEEYDRRRYGPHKFLYESNRNAFKQQFGDWVLKLRESDPEEYVARLLDSAITQRRRMPCLVFDNTDHFPQPFQESVFQFAQSFFRRIYSFVICPITDHTVWRLSKSGPLQSYESRAFYLPVPSTKDVLRKRVTFLKEKVSGERGDRQDGYFLKKGIRVVIDNIESFAACVEDIFVNEDYAGRVVGWLANHDIRRSLKIAQRIVTSPSMRVDDLVRAYLVGMRSPPRPRETKKALIVGDYDYYCESRSEFVANMFAVSPAAVTSPLLRLSILRLMMDTENAADGREAAYLTVNAIENFFEPMGIRRPVLDDHLRKLLEHRILEPYDPTDRDVEPEIRVRVTPAGRIHYEFAFESREGSYMQQMALTTPIGSIETLDAIGSIMRRRLTWEDWMQLAREFARYCLNEDARFVSVLPLSAYDGQRDLRTQFEAAWLR